MKLNGVQFVTLRSIATRAYWDYEEKDLHVTSEDKDDQFPNEIHLLCLQLVIVVGILETDVETDEKSDSEFFEIKVLVRMSIDTAD